MPDLDLAGIKARATRWLTASEKTGNADTTPAQVARDALALVAEVKRLREAAAAPVVRLAAGQVAVWEWRPGFEFIGGATANALWEGEFGDQCDALLSVLPDGARWEWSVAAWTEDTPEDPWPRGFAPNLDAARDAAEAAVVELARKGAPDAG